MTAVSSIIITNTNVNSGNSIFLNNTGLSLTYKKGIRVEPIPMLIDSTDSTAWDIAKGDRTGVESPQIRISGFIDVNESSTSITIGGTSHTLITIPLLKSLWRDATGTTTLNINLGYNDGVSGAEQIKNYKESSTDITVEIESIVLNPREDSEGLHGVDFEITCYEVR